MSDVREIHPKKPEPAYSKRLAMVGRVIAFTVFGAVAVPTVLAVVFGSVWVSAWLVRAIVGVF